MEFGWVVQAGICLVPVALPLLSWMCCSVSVSWLVRQVACTQEMIRTDLSPSRVILLPPSMTMWTGEPLLEIGGVSVAVTEIVTGSGPQSKVMIPPPLTALDSAWKVQLDGVPVPTTVVGLPVSTACASVGSVSEVHEPLGFPAAGNPPSPAVPASPETLPELEPPELEPAP